MGEPSPARGQERDRRDGDAEPTGAARRAANESAYPWREPEVRPLIGHFGWALTVDVEEWFHTCHVAEYVRPARRPPLAVELDRLLPELLELLAESGRQATFFVLGEVAERMPQRIRELAAAGHEVASHGYHHLRVDDRPPAAWLADLVHARELLEDVTGAEIAGYRAPEWSLRWPGHRCLPLVLEAGYRYDSSLAPTLGAGRRENPRRPYHLRLADGRELLELPPMVWGGPLQLPVCGWTGRLLPPRFVVRQAARLHEEGGMPLLTVHPWELSPHPTPGELTGLARFLHEAGRIDYLSKFRQILAAGPWQSIAAAVGAAGDGTPAASPGLATTQSLGPRGGAAALVGAGEHR
jgi:polysaccharide deacetylase family protein (PEP-CTERM system associated)